ncbi:MAG: tRNA dihydrouridine synthase DusB [Anaerolineales bacterium]
MGEMFSGSSQDAAGQTPFQGAARPEAAAPLEGQAVPRFFVRTIPIFGEVILSPMEGYSDLPFRLLCRELGSAMSYTEFVNTLSLPHKGFGKQASKLVYHESERPVVFQIFDDDPQRLLEGALRLQELGPDIIDINMGCPAKTVAGRGAGSGLLKTPLKIARIFRTLSKALEVPLTGKIRLGWDDSCRNYRLVARIVEENGGALLAVHGRTRTQHYRGQADWDAIAEIKQMLSIPVIGNGDVRRVADIARMKAHTGCDGVMIGRAAIGNPWIFAGLDREQVPVAEVRRVMLRHLSRMLAFYGRERGLVRFRKHTVQYLKPYGLRREARRQLLTSSTPEDFTALLDEVTGAA